MGNAHNHANDSYCKRNKVGAVLSIDGRQVMSGHNGTIRKLDNNCERYICNDCGNEQDNDHICKACGTNNFESVSSKYSVHAEQNLITTCSRLGIPTEGATLYVTVSPCDICAKLIIQSGITKVIYDKAYRIPTAINTLVEAGVEVSRFTELMEQSDEQ